MRNFAIDFLKCAMIIIIVCWHSYNFPALTHGYLAVDMFFAIAGYYLMNSFRKAKSNQSPLEYSIHRLKSFIKPYLIALLLSAILALRHLPEINHFDDCVKIASSLIYQITLTSELVRTLHMQPILMGTWFLSTLLISGFFLYGLLTSFKETATHLIIPLIVVCGYTFIFNLQPTIENWTVTKGISIPILRGVCDMSLGLLLYDFVSRYRCTLNKHSFIINFFSISSFILFILLMFTDEGYDVFIILFLPAIIMGCIIDKSWCNAIASTHTFFCTFIAKIGQISLYIYLIHPIALLICNYSLDKLHIHNRPIILLIDVSVSILCGFLLRKICAQKIKIQSLAPPPHTQRGNRLIEHYNLSLT